MLTISLFLLNPVISILAAYSGANLSFLILSPFSFSDAVSMYVRAGGKLCYLAAIQNAIPGASSLIHGFIPFTLPFSSCPQHHLFLIRTYFCRPLIPSTLSRYPRRLRRESKTALGIYSRAIVSFSPGYSIAYLGIHTKKLCVWIRIRWSFGSPFSAEISWRLLRVVATPTIIQTKNLLCAREHSYWKVQIKEMPRLPISIKIINNALNNNTILLYNRIWFLIKKSD